MNFAEADGPITGLVSGYGQLFIFTPDKVQVFIGDGGLTTTLGIQTLLDGVGCVAPDSIVTWDGKTIFLAHDGVRIFDGSNSVILSNRIEPVIRAQTPSQRRSAVAAVHKGRYWLAWQESDKQYNSAVFVYDLAGGWWTEFRPMEVVSLVSLSGADDTGDLLSGDSQGRVYWQDQGDTDDGEQIVSTWRSKVFTPSPGWAWQFRRLMLQMERMQGPLFIDWFTRSGARSGTIKLEPVPSGTVWGQFLWGNAPWTANQPAVRRASFPRGAVGPSIQLAFRQYGRGTWSGLTIQLWPKRRAR